MRAAIILFAKAPVPGRVKTRLAEHLGAARAAELHAALVSDMLETLGSLADSADIELHTDIETDAWAEARVSRSLQSESEDLGARMYHALEKALEAGRPRAMIVGSDVPGLPPSHLQELLAAGSDVALGPVEDGGYYAVACRRIHSAMFRGVRWSGPSALSDTVRAAGECGLSVALGPRWFDVDCLEDLRRLLAEPVIPRHTKEWLERNHRF